MLKVSCLNIDGTPLSNLVQWDLGKKIMIPDIPTLNKPLVYFYNKILQEDEAVSVVSRQDTNGNVVVDVPNFLLQKPYPLVVRVCDSGESTLQTVAIAYISVKATNKPSDYEYVENVTYTTLNVFYDDVDAEIQKIIYGIKDGSPKGVFTNISELNDKPSGIYINATDGYIYYWDGETLSDPIIQYQSTGIADGSIEFNSLSKELQSKYRNYVRGFKSSFRFSITIDKDIGMSVEFSLNEGSGSASLVWGNNIYCSIPDLSSALVEYESSLVGYKHIMLMYSPARAEDTAHGFYWLELNNSTQVTNDDFIVMFVYVKDGIFQHVIACDDVINKIFVNGEKYTNAGSVEESVWGLQNSLYNTQEDIQVIENRFNSTYRNYVHGFKSSFNFYINTAEPDSEKPDIPGRLVTFKPSATSTIWGNNIFANILGITEEVGEETVVHEYTASYSEFLSDTQSNIIMLMYSPSLGSANNDISVRKSAFYFKPFNYNQVTNDDYVIMVLYVNTSGIAYIIACDDVLNKIYIGKGIDVSSYTPYTVDLTAATAALEHELTQARRSYYDDITHESLSKHLYSTDTALKNHIAQYRNHCHSYIGDIHLDINTNDISMKVNVPSTGRAYSNNSFVNITKNSESEDGSYTVSGMDIITLSNMTSTMSALFYSPTSKEFYIILLGATYQPKSTNDLFICTMRIVAIETADGGFTIRVDEIVGCDDIISTITVDGVKWIPGYVENHNTCSIFSRVCCIGDSATAGHIDYAYNSEGVLPTDLSSSSVQLRRNEKYAWPAFMAKSTGNEYINLGISGATALTWLNDAIFSDTDKTIHVESSWLATGYDKDGNLITGAFETLEEKTDTDGETQYHIVYKRTIEGTDTISAYLVGLGMNDTLNKETEGNLVDGGTGTPKLVLCEDSDNPAADIGTGRETFYGKYSELIEKIHTVSPDAHIFVQTMHDNMNDRRILYNEAIRYIANYYSTRESNPIPVHVLDLYEYGALYKVDSIKNDKLGGHWSPIGYQQFAEILKRVWSDYLNAHPSEFKTIHLIPQEPTPEEKIANMSELIRELTERIDNLELSQTN